jgi:hypothetical protein
MFFGNPSGLFLVLYHLVNLRFRTAGICTVSPADDCDSIAPEHNEKPTACGEFVHALLVATRIGKNMKPMRRSRHLGLGMTLLIASATIASAVDSPTTVYDGTFPRLDFSAVMATGQSVAIDCQDEQAIINPHPYQAIYPYYPYDWPDAAATLKIIQTPSQSEVTVAVTDARLDTLYTLWLGLRGKTPAGVVYGGSPLTGEPGTPLIPTTMLAAATAALKTPVTDPPHGFRTDVKGNGTVTISLDFPIVGGAYPFERFAGFDFIGTRLPHEIHSIKTIAIVGADAGAPFTIRLASHCTDGVSHGLLPGPHEGWFDWKMN